MHARYIAVALLALGSLAVLVPACAGVAPDVGEDDDAVQEELRDGPREVDPFKRIVCRGSVDDCVKSCFYAGVPCLRRVEHPYKPEAGIGDLFACRTTGNKSCEYKYPNGEVCRFFKHPNLVLCT